jgi:hypothetical protein
MRRPQPPYHTILLRADTIKALLEPLPGDMTLSLLEAQTVIGCSGNWLDCGRIYGYGPRFVKDNGLTRYPVAYLREWIAQHTVDPRDVAAKL